MRAGQAGKAAKAAVHARKEEAEQKARAANGLNNSVHGGASTADTHAGSTTFVNATHLDGGNTTHPSHHPSNPSHSSHHRRTGRHRGRRCVPLPIETTTSEEGVTALMETGWGATGQVHV